MHPVTRHHLVARPRRAFTLIELIVTIVILGILAALAVPAFNAVIDRSRDSQAEQTWSAVIREAQAIAAFEDRGVTADDIAEALGDMTAADGVVDAAGAPYTYVDTDADDDGVADGVVGADQWSVDFPGTPTVLLASDADQAAEGRIVVVAIPAPGVNPVAEVRDYSLDGSAPTAADTQRHYDDAPSAGGEGGEAGGDSGYPADAMVLTFDSTLPGSSPPGTVSVALGNATVDIDWGDGTVESFTGNGPFSHTYATAGEHVVQVSGTAAAYTSPSYGGGNEDRLTAVLQWGDLGLSSLYRGFYHADNLTDVPADLPSTVISLQEVFSNITSFNDPDVAAWDTGNVMILRGVFTSTSFNQDISGWDTSSSTSMRSMFSSNTSFNQDISGWNVSNVTNMFGMFFDAAAFNQDLALWDVDQVTSCSSFATGTPSWTLSQPNFTSCTP